MNFIDLFAGAGGLSEGFIRAGFKPVAHVEMDKAACYTLKTRKAFYYLQASGRSEVYTSYLQGNITRKELYAEVGDGSLESIINLPLGDEFNEEIFLRIKRQLKGQKVDLIIGGPPCQAYSLVGRARSSSGMKGDPRNMLYVQYALYLKKYKPKMFVFENVTGLKSASKGQYLKDMEKLFSQTGYCIELFTVKASDFGVLQNRNRIIIIGYRKNIKADIPNLEEIKCSHDFSVHNVFEDLPLIQAGKGLDKGGSYISETNEYLSLYGIRNGISVVTQHMARPHTEQDKKIYKIAVNLWNKKKKRLDYNALPEELKTHKNRHSFFDRFKVVAGNLTHSHTVVAHIAKDGHYYIHPDILQNRSISVREAARLQSFPDNFYFEGVKETANRTAAFRQIGNAVPPLMAEKIAELISQVLKE